MLKNLLSILSFITKLFDINHYKAKREFKQQAKLAKAIKGSDGKKLARLRKLRDEETS